MRMRKVRNMLRVVVRGNEFQYDPPELHAPQLIEMEEKIALLRMTDAGDYIPNVGQRPADNLFYIELNKEDRDVD